MKKSKRHRQHNNYMWRWGKLGSFIGKCDICQEQLLLVDQYDAVCCPTCNCWIDKECGDPNCPFCCARPNTPAELLLIEIPSITKDYFIKKYEKRWRGWVRSKKEKPQKKG